MRAPTLSARSARPKRTTVRQATVLSRPLCDGGHTRGRRAAPDYAARVPSAKLLLVTGELIEVDGLIEEIEKSLQNAARSTPGTLAWLKDSNSDESVGVNPAHVAMLRPGGE